MKSAGTPDSMQRPPMAEARCVLPQPLGPVRTSQPWGCSAKRREAWTAREKCSWCEGFGLRPRGLRSAKVSRASGPRLLYRWRRAKRWSSRSLAMHSQANALPKSGWPRRTALRTKPAPPQRGHNCSPSSSAGSGIASGGEPPFALVVAVFKPLDLRISSRLLILPALGFPPAQNALDITPVRFVEADRLAESIADPVLGVPPFRLLQLLRD